MAALQHAYAVTNKWASATPYWTPSINSNAYPQDGRMDKLGVVPSTSGGGVNLVIDAGSAVALNAVATLNTNLYLATAPNIEIWGADDGAFSVNMVVAKAASNLNVTAPRHKDHVFQFPSTTRQWWSIRFGWTGSFALTIGEVFGALTTALSRFTVFGHSEDEIFYGSEFEGFSGETRGHFLSGPFRAKTLPFEELSESEKNEMMTLRRATYGGALPLLWCHQYEASATAAAAAYQDVVWGRLINNKSFPWSESDYGVYSVPSLTLKSLAREVGA